MSHPRDARCRPRAYGWAQGTGSSKAAGFGGAADGPPPGAILEVKRLSGAGSILTSGTAVTGKNTKFTSEVAVGDVIYVLRESGTLGMESAK